MRPSRARDLRCVALVGLLALVGCVSHPPAPSPYGARAAYEAQKMVGVRYRFGGDSPSGFDCSGLAYYAYRAAGLLIPRNSGAQLRVAKKIDLSHASAGDLLFFDTSWNRRHVAIYLGGRRFVHAPSEGKSVSIGSLDDAYFLSHLIRVGRFEG